MSIRIKFTIFLMVMVIAPVVIIGGYSYYYISTKLTEIGRSHLLRITQLKVGDVHRSLRDYLGYEYSEEEYAKFIEEQILNVKIAKNGFVFVTDRRGIVLIHPDKKMLGKDLSRYQIVQEVLKGKSGFGRTKIEGKEFIISGGLYGEMGWGIFAAMPQKEFAPEAARIRTMTLVVITLSIGVAFIFAFFIAKPIRRITRFAKEVSEGELGTAISIKAKDEIGLLAASINKMLDNLRNLASRIKEAGLKISTLSSQILTTSKQQSDGAAEQAAAVEEVGATIEELSSTAGQIANNTNDVVTAAEKTLKSAESGQTAIAETTHSMEDIRSRTLTSSQKIVALGEKSQQIGAVLEIINEIVAETKMLSLNASIEASKAGEAGKGFSVVAAEIRKLAEKAANSTATIEDIIAEIQSSVNETIMGTEENVKRVEAQAELVKKVGASLEEILPLAEATVELARQISAATHQQKAGNEQVVASMKEISDVSKQTAASSREATTTAEELDSLAEQLKEAISSFKFNGFEPQLTAKETKNY